MYLSRGGRAIGPRASNVVVQAVVTPDVEMSFPFGIDEDGQTRTYRSGSARISARAASLLLTVPGERRMRPNYGTNIRRIVFGSMDITTIQELLTSDVGINQAIATYAPEINKLSLRVVATDPMEGAVKLLFTILDNGPDLNVYRSEVTLA